MLSNMLHVDCQPSIIVFYGELALMKAIILSIFYVWHIEKNILFKCKPKEGDDCTFKTILLESCVFYY